MPRMQKQKYIAVWLRMLAEGEIRLARDSFKLLKAQSASAANAFKTSNSIAAVAQVLNDDQKKWQRVLMAHYTTTINHLAAFTYEQLTIKKPKSYFTQRVQSFIAKQGLNKSKLITESSIDFARQIINDGIENGDSEIEIAAAIDAGIGGGSRARTIARTETGTAASYAMQETAQELQDTNGLDMTKTWIAVEDERTRPGHADADGQEVGINDPFVVDGEEMDYPRDEGASAENVINCRCVAQYSITDAQGNETTQTEDSTD